MWQKTKQTKKKNPTHRVLEAITKAYEVEKDAVNSVKEPADHSLAVSLQNFWCSAARITTPS